MFRSDPTLKSEQGFVSSEDQDRRGSLTRPEKASVSLMIGWERRSAASLPSPDVVTERLDDDRVRPADIVRCGFHGQENQEHDQDRDSRKPSQLIGI